MFWNIFMHILMGLLGSSTEFFALTMKGMLISLGLVSLTQASEMARLYMEGKRKIKEESKKGLEEKLEAYRKEFKKTLPASYLQNLVMYTALLLFSAEIGRSSGYGL